MIRVFPRMQHVAVAQQIIDGKSLQSVPILPHNTIVTRVYPDAYDQLVEDPVPSAGRFADKKLIMLRRDPRDVAVSLYYSIRFSHTTKTRNRRHFLGRKDVLDDLDVAGGIAAITYKPSIKQFQATVRFLEQYPHTCLTTYETLVNDFPAWIRQIQQYMGWSDEQASRISGKLHKAVKPPARMRIARHKRRVKPGNWREVFDDRLRDIYQRLAGQEMQAAGYTWD